MAITTPTPSGYDQTSLRSRLLLHWRASDLSLVPITGQSETFSRSTSATAKDKEGRLYEVISERYRWHRVDANDGNEYTTLLLEGGRTNELTRSEALDHADWAKTNASVTADQATGPDGATSLDQLVEDSTNSVAHGVTQSASLTADKTYVFSVWAKDVDRTWLRLRLGDGTATSDTWFNLSTGATGTEGTTSGANVTHVRSYIRDWTDGVSGLYRCVIVVTFGNSATSITGTIALADANDSVTHNGDGSSSLYAGYPQLEE